MTAGKPYLVWPVVLFGALSVLSACATRPEAEKTRMAPLELEKPASAAPWVRYKGWPSEMWNEYSTLAVAVPSTLSDPIKFDGPITGDPKNGEKLAFDRSRGGGCVACHVMGNPIPPLPGNTGPDLSEYASWGRSDEFTFNYIYDHRKIKPDSMMQPWGAHKLYSANEIKDMVAFLKTQKSPAKFKDNLENPNTRPVPVETRDNFDPFLNEAMAAVEKGKGLFSKEGAGKKSCASCHTDPGSAFKAWAASMPKHEPRLNKVIGVEEFVTRHARATTGEEYLMQSGGNLALSIYLRFLANGQPINVNTASAEHKQAIKRGTALLNRKIGQLDMSCADCHTAERGANKWIRGQWLGEFRGQIDHFPTWRTSRSEIWDITKRLQWCNVSVRANELWPGAPEYGDIELTISALNNGMKLSVPGIRH
ncbi:MAG: Cytochrome c [Gallionellaceae bacterium]|nr:MAG: Cytochrome c [Gallionellaceae bacterium]